MTSQTTQTILGIDIGTSSVKSSIVLITVPTNSYKVLAKSTVAYNPIRIKSTLNLNLTPKFSQQNVGEIFTAIETALEQLGSDLEQIELIAVCGQMHGCVLWSNVEDFSDQYDWTDGRCDSQFLRSLPTPQSYADRISSGFGCATLFWLSRNQPEYLRQFSHSGTIMDLFVAVLCQTDCAKISGQNAHSWGYFDPERLRWNIEILKEANFPVYLLPEPVSLDSVVGNTSSASRFCHPNGPIRPDIPVMVAYGDVQSMMYLAFESHRYNTNSMVLNMGTSVQLCHRMEPGFCPPTKSTQPIQSIDYLPYKSGQYLAVVAGLNGGNALRRYVQCLQQIVHSLTDIELDEQEIWNRLTKQFQNLKTKKSETIPPELPPPPPSIQIKPTLFGERHNPEEFASIANIRIDNLPSLIELTIELCRSLLINVFDMMNIEHMAAIRTPMDDDLPGRFHLIATGSVLVRNPIVQTVLDQLFKERFNLYQTESQSSIDYIDNCDADLGCALFANQFRYKTMA